MDNMDYSKEMPSKDTSPDKDSKDKDSNYTEIESPKPSTATPSFPIEMPSKNYE